MNDVMMRMIQLLSVSVLLSLSQSCLQANGDRHYATIFPDEQGQLIETVFFDLKSPWAAKRLAEDDALYNVRSLFQQDGFNGIRTSIYGTRDHPKKNRHGKPAHPAPGVVDGQYYEQEVTALKKALAVNPELRIFASKKLNGPASFPIWVLKTDTDGDGIADQDVNPRKYAWLLVDYIEYMSKQGIPTHILGIDNEYFYNEGRITPQRHVRIVAAFRKALEQRNQQRLAKGEAELPMPQLIGPEDYYPNANQWMDRFVKQKAPSAMDIYGIHYYPEDRATHYELLQHDMDLAGERPKWHSELHWNTRPSADDFDESEDAIGTLWDCIDLGMTGFMWWDYQRDFDSFRGDVMREMTSHLLGYRPVRGEDSDGVDILPDGNLHTRALIRDENLVFYAVNISDRSYDDFLVELGEGALQGDALFDQWVDIDPAINNRPIEGTSYLKSSGIPDKVSEGAIKLNIPARSITMITLIIDNQDS